MARAHLHNGKAEAHISLEVACVARRVRVPHERGGHLSEGEVAQSIDRVWVGGLASLLGDGHSVHGVLHGSQRGHQARLEVLRQEERQRDSPTPAPHEVCEHPRALRARLRHERHV